MSTPWRRTSPLHNIPQLTDSRLTSPRLACLAARPASQPPAPLPPPPRPAHSPGPRGVQAQSGRRLAEACIAPLAPGLPTPADEAGLNVPKCSAAGLAGDPVSPEVTL